MEGRTLIIGILFLVLGVIFTVTGYMIKVKKRYDMVQNLVDKKRKEMDEEAYANRIGRREMLAGIACILAGILNLAGKLMNF